MVAIVKCGNVDRKAETKIIFIALLWFCWKTVASSFAVASSPEIDANPALVLTETLKQRIASGGLQPDFATCQKEAQSNSLDTMVTDWYVRQFTDRCAEIHTTFAEISGLDKNIPLIRFSEHKAKCTKQDSGGVCDCAERPEIKSFEKDFLEAFKAIAGNPIGRMLLYRILIETYRNDGKTGLQCSDVSSPISNELLKIRNLSRNIMVVSDDVFAIAEAKPEERNFACFKFSNKQNNICDQSILRKVKLNFMGKTECLETTPILIDKAKQPAFVAVFHELLHLYHILRNIERKQMEKTSNNGLLKILSPKTVGSFYYARDCDISDENRIGYTAWPWNNKGLIPTYNQEEHRTICGVPLPETKARCLNSLTDKLNVDDIGAMYLNGDELSENALLFSLNLPLRDGHAEFSYYDDSVAVNRILEVASLGTFKAKAHYELSPTTTKSIIYTSCRNGVIYNGTSQIARRGIGEFVIEVNT